MNLIRVMPAKENSLILHGAPRKKGALFYPKKIKMKTSRSNNNRQNKQGISKKPRPEIRDDMDSREKKEIGYKGDKSKKGDRKKTK